MTNSPNDDADGKTFHATHVDVAKDGKTVVATGHWGPPADAPPRPKRVITAVMHNVEKEVHEFWSKTIEEMVKAPNYHYVCTTRRPKRSDISDEQVIQASIDAVSEREKNWIFNGGAPSRSTLTMLIESTGTPRKVALAAIRRAESRGYVKAVLLKISIENACPTPEGRHFLATKDLRDRISELEKKLREARKVTPPVEPDHPGSLSPEQHYDLAETTLAGTGGFPYGSDELGDMLAEAQVHATLATYRKVEK